MRPAWSAPFDASLPSVPGLDLPAGTITYHLAEALWPLLDAVPLRTLENAPPWDGHTSAEVLARLRAWIASTE